MVKINGVEREADGQSLYAYLLSSNYDIKRIAVEKNGEIVSKVKYESTMLEDGDSLEIVSFVGGG